MKRTARLRLLAVLAPAAALWAVAPRVDEAAARPTSIAAAVAAAAALAPGCDAGCVACDSGWPFYIPGVAMPACPNCGYDESIAFTGCSWPNPFPGACPSQNTQCQGGGGEQPGGGHELASETHVANPEVLRALWAAAATDDRMGLTQLFTEGGIVLNEDRRALQAIDCSGNVLAHIPLSDEQFDLLAQATVSVGFR